uniref:Gypsy retrotransposon integrase-like protein 1 n=1 Tax=Xenopus tropicalis TaxID=8364 RepID=A0A803JXP8_XENTR
MWAWHFCDCLHFVRVRHDSLTGNNMPHVMHFAYLILKLVFVELYMQLARSVDTEIDFENEKVVYSLDVAVALPQHLLQELKDATEADTELLALKQAHSNGWPSRKGSADKVVQPYWPLRHEIHIEDGLVMIGDKFIIPKSCRPHMIERLHVAHQGIQRSKAQARMLMYWPNMGKDIELGVSTCNTCQEMLPSNVKEPLLTHDIPSMPWTKLAADIFDLYGHSYLLVIDYFSRYPEVLRLSDKSANSVIARLKAIFARHGIPQELVSDHVPFASHDMITFANKWDFKLTFSSPGYPQSNGMAERSVQTVKKTFVKAAQTGLDPHLALLSLRNTPVTGMKYSPAQLLMGRVLRSNLPASASMLKPNVPQNVYSHLQRHQANQKRYYDFRARSLNPFQRGDRVRMETTQGWQPAIVQKVRDEPRSYDVVTPQGKRYRRNRRHLRPDKVPMQQDTGPVIYGNIDSHDTQGDQVQEAAACSQQEAREEPSEPSTEHSAEPQRITVTKSGRVVRAPSRYKDFV